MRKLLLSTVFAILTCFSIYGQKTVKQGAVAVTLLRDHETVTIESQHNAYSVIFAVDYQNPEVALAYLDKENVNEVGFTRPGSFTVQNAPKTVKVRATDYKYTGYERGHMIPNDMFDYDLDKQKDTFAVYNISPQHPKCNADGSAWYKIEQQIERRAWAHGRVYVITGPILEKEPGAYSTISSHNIVVPEKYYKILISYNTDEDVKDFEQIEVYEFTNSKDSEKDISATLETVGYRAEDTLSNAINYVLATYQLKIELED